MNKILKNNTYENTLIYRKNEMVMDYLPAVKSTAFRLKERLPSSIDYADLISIGTEELIKLARKYDENQNDSFWGYAKKRVYGAMLDYLRSLDIVSRSNRKLIKDIEKITNIYLMKYNRNPSDDELAKELDEEKYKIKDAKIASEIYTVLPIHEQIHYSTQNDTLETVERDSLISSIKSVLHTLSKREQMVIQLYYFEELNLKEISEVLDITESRISQIHKNVILKIRDDLKGR